MQKILHLGQSNPKYFLFDPQSFRFVSRLTYRPAHPHLRRDRCRNKNVKTVNQDRTVCAGARQKSRQGRNTGFECELVLRGRLFRGGVFEREMLPVNPRQERGWMACFYIRAREENVSVGEGLIIISMSVVNVLQLIFWIMRN
jgi:hypothetical protein